MHRALCFGLVIAAFGATLSAGSLDLAEFAQEVLPMVP
jgi:hypothetical protein